MSWDNLLAAITKARVVCPHCGVKTNPSLVWVEGLVRQIPPRHYLDATHAKAQYTVLGPPYPAKHGYAVATCNGCFMEVVLETDRYASSVEVVWPLPDTQVPKDIPDNVRLAVIDAKRAFAAKSLTGALMSARTAVERTWRHHGASDLTELWKKKNLSADYFGAANEPRRWANVVTHGDFDSNQITMEDVGEILQYLDEILKVIYVTPAKLQAPNKKREGMTNSAKNPGE